jgi:alpha-galactosidase
VADAAPRVEVVREWNGAICRSRVINRGAAAVRLREVVLFDVPLGVPESTHIYGEGFQMLSQTAGTLAAPADLSQYTDVKHYKLPAPAGARAYYGLLTLTPPGDHTRVLAFTSCRRFSGQLRTTATSLQVVVDTENLDLGAGQAWDLEEFAFTTGSDRGKLLADVGDRLARNHPPLRFAAPPTGWCSWYCFGPTVTAKQVLDNLDAIQQKIPGLTYVQIDDGYQPAMGDWLDTGAAFGGDVRRVLDEIRKRGFQPAIWVAPFIAEAQSHLFQQHRDWFVQDASGAPLRSDLVTFGGWRHGPWYVLDGTHPEVQAHFEQVFRTMRQVWGCTYFKLDANVWGAIHGGRFHDARATRVEAYRRGMAAVLRGAGDSFILGCNHPIWPSAGLIHGSRSSNDIKRTWDRVKTTARQNLMRNWQNGRLWWNDPDAVVLTGDLTDDEFQFHASAIYASGGMVLSGDDLTTIPAARLAMLKKLVPPTGVAASFPDDRLDVGIAALPGTRVMCAFNWSDASSTISARLDAPARVTDFWTGESLGRQEGAVTLKEMPPHSARLLVCENA